MPSCGIKDVYYLVLTSALCPRVSPVVLLTVCAGFPTESIAALTLSTKLKKKKWRKKWKFRKLQVV